MYLAPELLVEELCLSGASISDLMLADIWALGMVLFSMLNPSLKCPYLVEIREAGGVKSQEELKTFIRSLLPLLTSKFWELLNSEFFPLKKRPEVSIISLLKLGRNAYFKKKNNSLL